MVGSVLVGSVGKMELVVDGKKFPLTEKSVAILKQYRKVLENEFNATFSWDNLMEALAVLYFEK